VKDEKKEDYGDLFSVRYHGIETYTTSRLVIFGDKLAIDGRKYSATLNRVT